MKKTRVLVLGLGNYGLSFAASVLPSSTDFAELVAAVDRNDKRRAMLTDDVPKYADLTEALTKTQPELVINVTPPAAHYEINRYLLENGYPVLCEKPIAESMETALKTAELIDKTKGFLMIGENYRYRMAVRKTREILENGDLGKLHRISCRFSHFHPDYSMFYHGSLPHPLLQDVTVHHLDLARFLSGEEPVSTWCKEYAAPYVWYKDRPASADIVTEMTGNVTFRYEGTLAAAVSSTNWTGDWSMECDRGTILLRGKNITIIRESSTEVISVDADEEDSRVALLKEACSALSENRKGETDFSDNFKSFAWMEKAIEVSD